MRLSAIAGRTPAFNCSTRRSLVAALLAVPLAAADASRAEVLAPADIGTLNHFAGLYNNYIQLLHAGVIDVKAWARVLRAWKAIVAA